MAGYLETAAEILRRSLRATLLLRSIHVSPFGYTTLLKSTGIYFSLTLFTHIQQVSNIYIQALIVGIFLKQSFILNLP